MLCEDAHDAQAVMIAARLHVISKTSFAGIRKGTLYFSIDNTGLFGRYCQFSFRRFFKDVKSEGPLSKKN